MFRLFLFYSHKIFLNTKKKFESRLKYRIKYVTLYGIKHRKLMKNSTDNWKNFTRQGGMLC